MEAAYVFALPRDTNQFQNPTDDEFNYLLKITNLRFADDIGGITGEEDKLAKPDNAVTKFGMEINADKTKIMKNNGTFQRYLTIQGQKLETVDHFKYLNAIVCDECSRREVLSSALVIAIFLMQARLGHSQQNY